MAFRTREEVAQDQKERRAIPEGVYPFQVHSATDGKSQKGAAMVSLELYVWDDNNRQRSVKDWLGEWEYGDVKVIGFCDATGIEYTSQMLTARDCVDQEGYLVLKIEDSEQYGPQNKVSYYVLPGDVDVVRERLAKKAKRTLPAQKFYKPEAVSVGAGEVADEDLPF